MVDVTGFGWQPIASLSDTQKDGRDVLFAEIMRSSTTDPRPSYWTYVVARWWKDRWIVAGDEDAGLRPEFRYWTDISPPG